MEDLEVKVKGIRKYVNVESIRPALKELERAAIWGYTLTGDYLSGHKVTIVLQTRGKKATCQGWFLQNGWATREGDDVHEITITSETLYKDPVEIVATVIHEIAHLANHEMGTKDVSKGGRHNKAFKETAESFGLEVLKPTDSRGFAYTKPSPALVTKIEKDFVPDVPAFSLFKTLLEPKPKQPSKTVAYQCSEGCPRIRAAAGKPVNAECNACGEHFTLVDSH